MATVGNMPTKACPQCGEQFLVVRKAGKPNKYCSDVCRLRRNYEVKAAKGYVSPSAWPKRLRGATPCKNCGKPTTRPKFCSVQCSWPRSGWRPESLICSECGISFISRHPGMRFCSTLCSKRKNNRKSSAMRRARILSLVREWFDPLEVLERDRWRCHLCGVSTPKRLRGSTDGRAPELDHIIPLAAGGEHSPRNTACSCRTCNLKKSDRPMGQLRLVA